jgi:murein DD-endopeptidase MepM/ murein hydrolase activator NlpD
VTSNSASNNSAIALYGQVEPHVYDTYQHTWDFNEDEVFQVEDEREAYEQSTNWRSPNPAKSAAYQAGQATRQAIGNAAATLQTLEYAPPQWIGDAAAHELAAIKKELARQNRLAHKQVYSKILSWNTYSIALGLLTMGACNVYVVLASQFGLPLGQYASRGLVGTTDAIYSKEIKEGDTIDGYMVTSGFGSRTAPKEGASTQHEGVDLGIPEGTNLYMIGDGGSVTCKEQPDGAGTYAEIAPKGLPFTFKAMHLSACQSGDFGTAQGFAQTGNTGNSTGAHLHWGMFKDGKAIAPTEGYLLWALTGNAPKPHGGEKAKTGFGGVDDFAQAIAQQESGGDISIVNPIGAMGKYQFMPGTLASVAPSCVGHNVSPDEFLKDENLQDQIAKCYWQPELQKVQQQTSDSNQQCRMMAAFHYSGDSSLWDDPAPQSGGNPSIADYSKQVCSNVGVKH